MTEYEYLKRRVLALETAVRSIMAIVIDTLPPGAADNLNRMGWEWDKRLDALAASQPAPTTDKAQQ